jgi:hypothetical protein
VTGTAVVYQTKIFSPSFSVELPPGWIVAERDRAAAQLYRPCDTCVHDGEENGEITLGMELSEMSPDEAIARLREARNVDAGPAEAAQLGSLSGFRFTATRTGKGEVRFQDSGYRSEAEGEPFEVFAVTGAGQTVMIFVDPHTSRGSDFTEFTDAALEIAKTIRFGGR